MMTSQAEIWLTGPSQGELDWLLGEGVKTEVMVHPTLMLIATGHRGADGRFEHDDGGERWLAFEQDEDVVFWQPRRNLMATYAGHAFALGEDIIVDAATYAFDCALNIFARPLDWLRAGRDGIVIRDCPRAFDRLRDAPRIAIAESLLPLYRHHMRPARVPELFVISERRQAA